MEAVETACREKARDRVGPAFDQNAPEAACRERGDNTRRGKLAVFRGKLHDLDPRRRRGWVGAGDDEPADTVSREHPCGCWQPTIGVRSEEHTSELQSLAYL